MCTSTLVVGLRPKDLSHLEGTPLAKPLVAVFYARLSAINFLLVVKN